MAVETDNDRADVLSDFGVTVIIGALSITAIFDDGYEDALGSWVTIPILTARTIDVSGYSRGTSLTISGVAYTIEEQQPDGQGMSQVILQRT